MSLLDRLRSHAIRCPARPALVEDGRVTNYKKFFTDILERRKYFSGYCRSGELVSLESDRVEEAWINAFALRSLGCTTAMIQVPEDLRRANFWPIRHVFPPGRLSLRSWMHHVCLGVRPLAAPSEVPRHSCSFQQEFSQMSGDFVLQSSGTSGKPKYVRFSGASELLLADYIARQFSFDERTVFNFLGLPLWTGVGGKFPLAIWNAGGTCVFDRRPDHLSHIWEFATTHAYVGLMEIQSLNRPFHTNDDEEGSRMVLTGGGPISRRSVEILTGMPELDGRFGLGSTELAGWSLQTAVKHIQEFPCWMDVCPGRVVEVVDEHGRLCPENVQGTLRFQLKDVDCRGYVGDAKAEKTNFREGYFYPGNHAVKAADGRVQVLGSVGDLLTIKGIKQAPAKLEAWVCKACDVDHCLIFSRSNKDGFDELIIVVEGKSHPDLAARQAAEAGLPKVDAVRWFYVDRFPRSKSGLQKIQRSRLRAEIFEKIS